MLPFRLDTDMVPAGDQPGTIAALATALRAGVHDATILGVVSPNPAIQSNRCHTVLAQGCNASGKRKLDTHEEIGVRLVPLTEIGDLIRRGIIHHSLVVAAFHHYALKTSA